MALPLVPLAISAGGSILGGIAGGLLSSGDRKRAEDLANEAYSIISQLNLPPDESKALILEKFKEAGIYTPQLEENLKKLPDSAFEQIKTDQRLKDAQMEALTGLQQAGRVGLGPQERAALAVAQDEAAREASGRAGQITQQMAARGAGGSGAELAMQIANQQAEANRESLASLQAGGMASQRALQALQQSGALGGQMESQQYQQQANLAQNRDAISRFNTQLQNEQQRANIERLNQAQLSNLQNRQRIADMNVGQQNTETQRQSNARRQYWQDQAQRAAMLSNARLGQASQYSDKARGTQQSWQNIGSGLGQVGAGLYAGGAFKGSTPDPYSSIENLEKDSERIKHPYDFDNNQTMLAYDGGLVEEPSQELAGQTTVVPDSGWGKIIIKGSHGMMVPGQAPMDGVDHPMNDIVDAKLSPGEAVIPKSIMEHPHAPERAAGYIQALLQVRDKYTKK